MSARKSATLKTPISTDMMIKKEELNNQFMVLCEHYTEEYELTWSTEGWRTLTPRPLLPSKVKNVMACTKKLPSAESLREMWWNQNYILTSKIVLESYAQMK